MLVWKATDEATSPVGRSRRGNRSRAVEIEREDGYRGQRKG